MVQASVETPTLDSFLAMPETKPASEYTDGKITQKPMPKGKHSILQASLTTAINEALSTQQIAFAFPELRCTFSGRSIVPDVSVFTWSRIPIDQDGEVANEFKQHPDWAIEILSPDQSQTPVWNKIIHALNYGTQMGWLVDPQGRSVLTCSVGAHPQLFTQADQKPSVPEFAAPLALTLGTVFGWLKFGG